MDAISFRQREVELNAINVVQGVWIIERQRVLRTILGSCVSVCLYDRLANVGGMNHYVYPPLNECTAGSARITTMSADICMDGLLEAVLKAGARHEQLRAKAFGGGAMFAQESGPLAVGKRNASFAKSWLAQQGIPLDLFDFHGNCARKLMFHPASGQHLCIKLPATLAPLTPGAD